MKRILLTLTLTVPQIRQAGREAMEMLAPDALGDKRGWRASVWLGADGGLTVRPWGELGPFGIRLGAVVRTGDDLVYAMEDEAAVLSSELKCAILSSARDHEWRRLRFVESEERRLEWEARLKADTRIVVGASTCSDGGAAYGVDDWNGVTAREAMDQEGWHLMGAWVDGQYDFSKPDDAHGWSACLRVDGGSEGISALAYRRGIAIAPQTGEGAPVSAA